MKLRGSKAVSKALASVGDVWEEFSQDTRKALAERFIELVRKGIQQQRYRHVPLSTGYLAWKRRMGLDERILIATGDYVRSFQVRREERKGPQGKQIVYTAGPPDEIHPPSGLNYRTLARIHEFGTATIPARPHWGPAWRQLQATEGQKVLKQAFRRFYQRVRRRTRTVYASVLSEEM
jgi:hypothetical protein